MKSLPYPYDVLLARGIHPRSMAREVRDFFPTNHNESAAWRALQSLRSRLKTDFFLYIVRDGAGLADLLRGLREAGAPGDVNTISPQLGDDTPVLLLSLGRRAEARQWVEEAQAGNVFDGRPAHLLALISLAEAQQFEEEQRYAQAVEAWHVAIPNWVRTLAHEAYLDAWYAERQRCYDDRSYESSRVGFKTAVREDLYKHLRGELARVLDERARAADAENARMYAELLALYDIERWGAEALSSAGGIGLDDGRRLSCGPIGVVRLRLEQEFGRTMEKLQSDQDRFNSLSLTEALRPDREPVASGDVVRRLRLFFSQLSRVAAFVNYNRPEQALEHLAAVRGGPAAGDLVYGQLRDGAAIFLKDSTELSVQANLSAAFNAITSVPMDLVASSAAWRRAFDDASLVGLKKLVSRAVTDQALGRALALKNESGRDLLEELNEAVSILEQARPLADDSDRAEITDELVEALTHLSGCYRERDECRMALDSIDRARVLAPGDPEVLAEYSACLIHQALELGWAGSAVESLALLERAKELATGGLSSYPENASLQRAKERAQVELSSQQGRDPLDEALDAMFQSLREDRIGASPAAVRESIKRAEAAREAGDYDEAEAEILRALALDPNSAWAKAEAVQLYAGWCRSLKAEGELEEAKRKADAGLAYDAVNPQLRELLDEISRAT